jgi:hypothetical protein
MHVALAGLRRRKHLVILAVGILIVVGARLLAQDAAAAPSGPDPGNWLRVAWRLSGDGVDTPEFTYPPLLPLLLRGLLYVLSPMLAVKLLGLVSSVVLVLPCYLLLRGRIVSWAAAVLSVCVLAAGYQQEVYGWGGYPQLLATAFLLLALYWLLAWLAQGTRRELLLSAACVVLTAATSHFVAGQLVLVGGLTLGGILWRSRGRRDVYRRVAGWIVVCALASLVLLPWYVALLKLAASPTTNATNFSWLDVDSYRFVFRESPVFGFGYAIVGAAVTPLHVGGRRARELRPVLLGLVWGPFLLFAATGEVRHFQLTQIGIILSLSLLVSEASLSLRSLSFASLRLRQVMQASPAVVLSAFLLVVAIQGRERLVEATTWYRTIDEPGQAALDFIRTETPENSAVLVGTSSHGLPYGWWVEGYARRRMYQHVNPAVLLFKSERDQAALVAHLLSDEVQPSEAAQFLRSNGIDYVLIAPGTDEFLPLLRKVALTPVFENSDFSVLRVDPPQTTRQQPR